MADPPPPAAGAWYEVIVAHDDTIAVADEAEGMDFLKQTKDTNRKFTKPDLVQLNNVLCQYGGDKPSPKTNKKAHAQYEVDCFTNDLSFIAVLTKNDVESVALPIDVSTIRKYDLMAKDFKLPPYQVNDTSTLLSAFLKIVGEIYALFQSADEKDFTTATKGDPSKGVYMPKTNYEKQLLPALGNIIRYNIKFWHLHPWLTRKDAHKKAMEYLRANYKKRGDITKMIIDLLNQRKLTILKAKVLELPTISNGKPNGELVFSENEGAQFIMEKYLKAHKYPIDKTQPDILFVMQAYINSKLSAEEKVVFSEKFQHIVPNETAVYLDKKQKLEEKALAKEKKRLMEEAWAKQQLEKKQKLIQQNLAETARTTTASTVRRSNITASPEIEGAEGEGESADAVVDPTDKFAEFKLKIGEHTCVPQKEAVGKRRTEASINAGANRGITKAIVDFDGPKAVAVEYTFPGRTYKKEIGK